MTYNQEYNKKHYKAFKVDLKIDELEELETLLRKLQISKATFLRNAIKELKNKNERNN